MPMGQTPDRYVTLSARRGQRKKCVKYCDSGACCVVNCSLLFSGRELAFTFANCRRNSVCRLSVCNVGAPYSGG